jgi:hypothetical protein
VPFPIPARLSLVDFVIILPVAAWGPA